MPDWLLPFFIFLGLLSTLVPVLLDRFIVRAKLNAIFKPLSVSHGFSLFRARLFHSAHAIGRAGGCLITIDLQPIHNDRFIRIQAERPGILPAPFIMEKRGDRLVSNQQQEQAPVLLPEHFKPLNTSLGRALFTKPLTDKLTSLETLTAYYLISRKSICLFIPFRAAEARHRVKTLMETASGTADLLHWITKNTPLRLHALNLLSRPLRHRPTNIVCLKLLAREYRDDPLARETFRQIAAGTDYQSGAMAADALGLGLIAYLKKSFHRFQTADKISGLHDIAALKTGAGADYLVSLFSSILTGTREPDLLVALMRLFQSAPDERALPLCLKALNSKSEAVREAAIALLAEQGGEEAIGPLYRFFRRTRGRDEVLEGLTIRGLAGEAIARIKERLGGVHQGRLSLARADSADGALSLDAGSRPDVDNLTE
jgi:hypothetical protein